ncbi:hypothetical protein SAMN06265360_11375 [Haloechinothrix alba]|uniref:Uncharacterized protein n=1 Tax=Haloechinothrix alba TaxID=664784 RepID=A0A238Y3T6_9PSEU|nr:DUF6008 family protein [Haloechinothrix alba]SNR65323.1 hypothetical protein SAMN06265360_11375 [Haloechinothrix alba]
MGIPTPLWSIAAALLVLWAAAMWTAVAVLARANRNPVRPWLYRASAGVIVLGVLGQLGHVQEHIAQVAYWTAHPNSPAWMTPWGDGLAAALGRVNPAEPSLGMEILHLTGNVVFLAGLAGIMLITRHALRSRSRTWARMGVWMQGIHGVEHLALTLSVALGAGRAIGLSTWFGLLDPGPGLWTYRIWWHFIANIVGTVIFGIALYHLWRERREVEAAYRTPAGPASAVPGRRREPQPT